MQGYFIYSGIIFYIPIQQDSLSYSSEHSSRLAGFLTRNELLVRSIPQKHAIPWL